MSKIWKTERVNITPKKSGLKRESNLDILENLTDIEKIKLTNDGYDKTAKEWDATRQTFWEELSVEIKNVIEKNIDIKKENTKEALNILDLGCGNGRLVNELKDFKINYIGIDPSKELIKISEEKYDKKYYFKVFDGIDFESLNFEKEYFDCVMSIAVMHHIPKNLIDQWLKNVYYITKTGSISIFTTWNLANSYYEMDKNGDAVIGFMNYKDTRFVHNYSQKEMQDIFLNAGYKVLETKEISRNSGMSNIVIIVEK